MKKTARRLLRWTARGLAFLLLAVLAAFAALVWRPEWLLTPPVLTRLTERFGGPYQLRWSSFSPSLRSVTLLDKRLSVRAEKLCLRYSGGAVDGCLDTLDAAVTVRLGWPLRVASVDRLLAASRGLTIDETLFPPPVKPAPGPRPRHRGLAGLVPKPLRRARIGPVSVTLTDAVLVLTATSAVSGDLSLSYSTAQAPPLDLKAQLYYETPDTGENLAVRLSADSDYFSTGRLRRLRAAGRVSGDAGDSAFFEARVAQRSRRETTVDLTARGAAGGQKARLGVSGTLSPAALKARLTGEVDLASGAVSRVALSPCELNAYLGPGLSPRSARLDCRVTARPASLTGAGKPAPALAARVSLDGKAAPTASAPDRFEATLRASLEPVKRWFQFRADLTAKLSGRLRRLPESLRSRHSLAVRLSVPKFQDLVAYLRGTPYSIPAPFHVLEGPLELTLRSEGDTTKPDQLFTYQARSDLAKGRQKAAISVKGQVLARRLFEPDRRFDDKTEVALEDVALELPYLTIGAVPPVTVDSRIRTGEEPRPSKPAAAPAPLETRAPSAVRSSTSSRVGYAAHVTTTKPILLYTNLNPSPVPVALDLDVTPAGAAGKVTIEPFPAELFKRKADIDHVTIALDPAARQLNLDGLIKIAMPDAEITLKLLGTTEKPQVVFESDPPMSQQDIVAMLIFGKTPAGLDPDQKTTASNSQSALASGAFGFASLYLFASTPIQYVGYDPTTQTYAMKFSLPGGASLEVGSDTQQQSHLTLRKRLARHWIIATEYQRTGGGAPTTSGPAQNAVTTFLEWFQRY